MRRVVRARSTGILSGWQLYGNMTIVEGQLAAAVEALKKIGATLQKRDLAVLDTAIRGIESMRPYAGVGLKVRAPDTVVEAINSLHRAGVLQDEPWTSLMQALRLAHETNQPQLRRPSPIRALPPMRLILREPGRSHAEARSRRLRQK